MAKVVSQNKEAFFNYSLIVKYEAGLVLEGWEIKSIRAGRVQLKGAFVTFRGDEAFVSNMNISNYMNVQGDNTKPRKLLLHKSQLKKLQNGLEAKGMTIVPVRVKITARGLAKLDIAIARGKSKEDKREAIKKRDIERKVRNYF